MVLEPGAVTQKWAAAVRAAQPYYMQGVQGKGDEWYQGAIAGEPAYAEGVQRAIATGARTAGIQAAGPAKWEQAVTTKGPVNWVAGVTSPSAQQRYTQNFGPILGAIAQAKATLPPRGAPMSDANMARFTHMITAVHNAARSSGIGTPIAPIGAPAYGPVYGPPATY